MLSSQIVECLMSQALVWIAEHFPDSQPEEVQIYQEVYVNRILNKVAEEL
ncbi:MAG: hypothetical protein NW237_03920 [Cyanobacteriota bacterium]|nr:hypothetical protein [Cyanobacteriota bacterium]